MIQDHQLSERHACRLVGLSRDSYRNPPQPDQLPRVLCDRIMEIANVRRRFGYRRIHDLLRPEFPQVNQKRVYRLYRDANLAVRRRKKAKRPLNERVPLQLAQTVNEVWSMDYNEVRTHSSLGRIPPAQFAQQQRINSNAVENKNHQVWE